MSKLPLLIGLAYAVSTSGVAVAAQAIDHVPQDFPTIQDAVDRGSAPVILVAAGDYDGATVNRGVAIRAEQGASIVGGPGVLGVHAGFVLGPGATNAQIVGFEFACGRSTDLDLGIMASARQFGGAPSDVTVSGNTFHSCVQGVTNSGHPTRSCDPKTVDGGADWAIEDNVFDGIRSTTHSGGTGGGLGIFLFNAQGASVIGNSFTGRVQDSARMATSGVLLAGCWDCTVSQNIFRTRGATHFWSAIANLGAYQSGAASSQRLLVDHNDARGDAAPQMDINYRSYDSYDTTFHGNSGVTFVDHSYCGDGTLDTYENR